MLPFLASTATDELAAAIKHLPLPVTATRPLDEAISTAGGVAFEALDEKLMLRDLPGVFCAGEMLDWEAPTGGYLLTARVRQFAPKSRVFRKAPHVTMRVSGRFL